ncbi:MAG: TIGR03960 family B12-binding radical SAM protein [Eubacteriales bacterium]
MYSDKLLKSVLKPGRYSGGEYAQIIKDKNALDARMVFCFPDTYEIGMSNLGVRLLYGVLNTIDRFWCERAYAPWVDMERELRAANEPLRAHESGDPLSVFDIVGFTLQYELCYTNVLNMLELGGIPLMAAQRGEGDPIVLGGGPCAYNAEPVAEFFDVFSIGEGEDALCEFARLYIKMKTDGVYTREKFLREVSHLEGFYVPSLYDVSYNPDGTISAFAPKYPGVPAKITKRIMRDMDKAYYPSKLVMPYIETVHDRVVLEVYRGCIRGCRFCQAGMIFRPVREKSPEVLDCKARELVDASGFDEISLSSLSISDYSKLDELTDRLLSWTNAEQISLSLPSLRVDSFTKELMDKISTVRTGGLTFAPEAGTQRLRDAINKNVCEDDLFRACRVAFEAGKSSVKLYFMQGLPTEQYDDLDGIAKLAKDVIDLYYTVPRELRGRSPQVTVSVSCFIPKPFTPFQWEGQDALEVLCDKQKYLGSKISDKKIRYNWHEAKVSRLEAVFARGNRRLAPALLEAHKRGVRFDSWDEFFDYDKWMEIFGDCGIDPAFYANREFGADEILPWDNIDIGVTKEFLRRERDKAYEHKTTPNCREQCSGCGANRLGGERTPCPKL